MYLANAGAIAILYNDEIAAHCDLNRRVRLGS